MKKWDKERHTVTATTIANTKTKPLHSGYYMKRHAPTHHKFCLFKPTNVYNLSK